MPASLTCCGLRLECLQKAYFNKQEEQLLRVRWRRSNRSVVRWAGPRREGRAHLDAFAVQTMLKKMKSQAEVVDPVAAKVVKEAERASLLAIVGKYKLAEEDIQKLIDWRHDSH